MMMTEAQDTFAYPSESGFEHLYQFKKRKSACLAGFSTGYISNFMGLTAEAARHRHNPSEFKSLTRVDFGDAAALAKQHPPRAIRPPLLTTTELKRRAGFTIKNTAQNNNISPREEATTNACGDDPIARVRTLAHLRRTDPQEYAHIMAGGDRHLSTHTISYANPQSVQVTMPQAVAETLGATTQAKTYCADPSRGLFFDTSQHRASAGVRAMDELCGPQSPRLKALKNMHTKPSKMASYTDPVYSSQLRLGAAPTEDEPGERFMPTSWDYGMNAQHALDFDPFAPVIRSANGGAYSREHGPDQIGESMS